VIAEWTQWADEPGLVSFYQSHRDHPDALYPSERRFLPWLARESRSVLDAGCAAGGFVSVWRHFKPEIEYVGVDVSAPLIAAARRRHPEVEFLLGDCAAGIPRPAGSSETVEALGWLHWEPRYRAALAELWRLAGRRLFFDVRIVEGGADLEGGRQRLDLGQPAGAHGTTPYICCSWPRFAEMIGGLGPARVLVHGYWGTPAETVSGVDQDVCFTTFVLERLPESPSEMAVAMDAPLSWPDAWSHGVRRLPDSWLEQNVPPSG
jgi:SAM-dependent methyltransferase